MHACNEKIKIKNIKINYPATMYNANDMPTIKYVYVSLFLFLLHKKNKGKIRCSGETAEDREAFLQKCMFSECEDNQKYHALECLCQAPLKRFEGCEEGLDIRDTPSGDINMFGYPPERGAVVGHIAVALAMSKLYTFTFNFSF